jgi:hypothetical protein
VSAAYLAGRTACTTGDAYNPHHTSAERRDWDWGWWDEYEAQRAQAIGHAYSPYAGLSSWRAVWVVLGMIVIGIALAAIAATYLP